jgi:inosine-uridine nucleoside N-ribohydrolase
VVCKIILDCDPGIDDALAILFALKSPEVNLQAITTVSGNVHVDLTSLNALKCLEVLNIDDVIVAKGFCKPMIRELVTAEHYHGLDGLGDSNLPFPKLSISKKHAVDIIIDNVMNSRGDLAIVSTGPLTNIAFALLKKPEIVEKVKEIVIMGGAFGLTRYGLGNITPVSEYNIYTDPEAANIVFSSELNISIVGLDVTMNPASFLTRKLFKIICDKKTPLTEFISTIARNQINKIGYLALHDPIALSVIIDRNISKTRSYNIDIETIGTLTRGQTIVDKKNSQLESRKNISVCIAIDNIRFIRLFIERILS